MHIQTAVPIKNWRRSVGELYTNFIYGRIITGK
jgi:hypothetical protein